MQTAEGPRPFYKKWPFWAGIGTAVAAGTVVAIAVTRGKDACGGSDCSDVTFRRTK